MSRFEPPPGRAEERFPDKPPLSPGRARVEAARCLYCHDAPCIPSCPTAIDIPTFIRKIATGNVRGAARTILRANLLGASCARVCPVEVLCESTCVWHELGGPPIQIGRLQRHAMEHGGPAAELLEPGPDSGRSVGLVGAGPASLACAAALRLLGHGAVLYERGALPGGLNTTGVAPYKLKVRDALEEVETVLALGARLETGVEVGRDLAPEELLSRHDAVFLGIGLGADGRLGVPGEEGPGVWGAVEWIAALKTDPAFSIEGVRRVVVVGGGNTAIDAAREACGLGLDEVRIVYRRDRGRMPGYAHELAAALEAGASLVENAVVSEILRDREGGVQGVRLVEAREGRPTDRELGVVACDLVLVAIGQAKLAELARAFPGVETDERGRIVVDPATMRTGHPRVFAGGDAVNGGKEVVNAAHDGQLAARSIDAMLRAAAAREASHA